MICKRNAVKNEAGIGPLREQQKDGLGEHDGLIILIFSIIFNALETKKRHQEIPND